MKDDNDQPQEMQEIQISCYCPTSQQEGKHFQPRSPVAEGILRIDIPPQAQQTNSRYLQRNSLHSTVQTLQVDVSKHVEAGQDYLSSGEYDPNSIIDEAHWEKYPRLNRQQCKIIWSKPLYIFIELFAFLSWRVMFIALVVLCTEETMTLINMSILFLFTISRIIQLTFFPFVENPKGFKRLMQEVPLLIIPLTLVYFYWRLCYVDALFHREYFSLSLCTVDYFIFRLLLAERYIPWHYQRAMQKRLYAALICTIRLMQLVLGARQLQSLLNLNIVWLSILFGVLMIPVFITALVSQWLRFGIPIAYLTVSSVCEIFAACVIIAAYPTLDLDLPVMLMGSALMLITGWYHIYVILPFVKKPSWLLTYRQSALNPSSIRQIEDFENKQAIKQLDQQIVAESDEIGVTVAEDTEQSELSLEFHFPEQNDSRRIHLQNPAYSFYDESESVEYASSNDS